MIEIITIALIICVIALLHIYGVVKEMLELQIKAEERALLKPYDKEYKR